ncbi:MAG: pro-sigmaK processing inhibitor BofA family protein [Clostridia bacterium]|nr:pro-sigmaK processing inhibitor BofA family protein [Clostridia bacterium]
MNFAFISAAIICTVCVLWWMIKSEKGGVSFIKSAFQGLAGMFAVNLLGMVTGVTIAVNWYSIAAFIILGLPGVIGALILNLIFNV